MKVPREAILITEIEGEKFFPREARNYRPYAPLCRCLWQRHRCYLAAQPPHPRGASDGPALCYPFMLAKLSHYAPLFNLLCSIMLSIISKNGNFDITNDKTISPFSFQPNLKGERRVVEKQPLEFHTHCWY